ncbi:Hypothetical predicted protein [Octopus vulgaris]|uniref:Uncharacterized protein n=2 Tax=Octopus TaxID=6643 RepID=A0AA36AXU3_OCTVU|nr:uncharacterized protein LOC115212302 isoform X1 [Octopus sinensis]CAI9722867.1 Hypothetical predicted protein [Octopus vulgaris]
MQNQYTTMVHDFGLRGYHIMNTKTLQPPNSLSGNRFKNLNLEPSFESLPYFYKNICSSEEATRFMNSLPAKKGQFIIRKSSKGSNYLSITVELSNRHIKHVNIKIVRDSQGGESFCLLYELGNFKSLASLIEYYKVHPIDNIEKVQDVKLLYPIMRKPSDSDIMDGVVENFHGSVGLQTNNNQQVTTPDNNNFFLESRPPAAVPPTLSKQQNVDATQSSFYYTYVQNMNEDRSRLLWQTLRMEERCMCGIRIQDSQLPDNFTVHQIQDSNGWRLYFQDQNKVTSWILPDHVIERMEPFHWNNLTKLYAPKPLPEWLQIKRAILISKK